MLGFFFKFHFLLACCYLKRCQSFLIVFHVGLYQMLGFLCKYSCWQWNQNQQKKKAVICKHLYRCRHSYHTTSNQNFFFLLFFSSSLYDWTAALRSLYTDPVLNISPVLLEKEAFKCRRASLSYNPAEALLLPLADFHRPPHPTPLPPHSLSISFPLSLSAAMAEQQ